MFANNACPGRARGDEVLGLEELVLQLRASRRGAEEVARKKTNTEVHKLELGGAPSHMRCNVTESVGGANAGGRGRGGG